MHKVLPRVSPERGTMRAQHGAASTQTDILFHSVHTPLPAGPRNHSRKGDTPDRRVRQPPKLNGDLAQRPGFLPKILPAWARPLGSPYTRSGPEGLRPGACRGQKPRYWALLCHRCHSRSAARPPHEPSWDLGLGRENRLPAAAPSFCVRGLRPHVLHHRPAHCSTPTARHHLEALQSCPQPPNLHPNLRHFQAAARGAQDLGGHHTSWALLLFPNTSAPSCPAAGPPCSSLPTPQPPGAPSKGWFLP